MTARAAALAALACGAGVVALTAAAQTVDVERARTLVVGTPPGARMDRVDGARTGHVATVLPTGGLRSEWRLGLGVLVDQAPLVDAHGVTRVLGTRGEVVAVGRDGAELWRVATGAGQPGPGALLSDDTLVFADAAGEAVAVRAGAIRWRVRFARNDPSRPAPLALGDGGVVIATAHDLAVLDADGNERARATLRDETTGPLVAVPGAVLAVGSTGTVWRWELGAGEPLRVGAFGSPTDGGGVLARGGVLVAVTAAGAHLSALDLASGASSTLATAAGGLWLGPPAVRDGLTTVDFLAPAGELAVTLEPGGAEAARVLLATHSPPVAADGGPGALAPVAHAPFLVDDAGTLAFATAEGALGVAAEGASETLPGACPVAPRARPDEPSGAAGLAPLGAGAFVAVCHAGTVMAIHGRAGERAPSPL